MVGHYLGEFSVSYRPVKHGRPGIGATHCAYLTAPPHSRHTDVPATQLRVSSLSSKGFITCCLGSGARHVVFYLCSLSVPTTHAATVSLKSLCIQHAHMGYAFWDCTICGIQEKGLNDRETFDKHNFNKRGISLESRVRWQSER